MSLWGDLVVADRRPTTIGPPTGRVHTCMGPRNDPTPPRPRRRPRHPAEPRWGLTAPEIRVLELIAQGLTYPQMAERLNRSVGTVASTAARMREKMGTGSSAESVRLWQQPPEPA